MTYTFVLLDVSPACFYEIHGELLAADYGHAFLTESDGRLVIDMHGIALRALVEKKPEDETK
jgi:hypothetical protein